MKKHQWALWALIGIVGLIAGGAFLMHYPETQRLAVHFHRLAPHGPPSDQEAGAGPPLNAAIAGVAALGARWDAEAYAETLALFTAVHRELEWPGLLEPQTIQYGPDSQQTFELYLPEQGFSEPGPVFVFLHGNGLGNSDRIVPGSEGLIFSHMGKLGATFGGIGLNMSYRNGSSATLESQAEDLSLVIEWIVDNIAPYGGDPDTIVVLGNSEGAIALAAYLFNEAWQRASGPGIAAAILSSGRFDALAPTITDWVDGYRGEHVPLALWSGEFDTAEVAGGIAALNEQLCGKHGDCPMFDVLQGHNHVSHVMSLGTQDNSVLNAFIRFYHTVR